MKNYRQIGAAVAVFSILFLLMLVAARHSHATNFPPAERGDTITLTLLSASGATTTNTVGSAYRVEGVLNHTFQCINIGSAAQLYVVDWSLDNTNWIPSATNSVGATSTVATNLTGKFTWIRARQLGTNDAMAILYLGGN